MTVLRSLLFALGLWVSTLLYAPLALMTFPFPLRARYRFITTWARLNVWWLRVTCGLDYRVEGREHIPAGAAIVFCKHQSTWETFALPEIFPYQVWLMKRELLRIPLFGWGIAMLDPIAIDRRGGRKAIEQLVEQGARHLAGGRWVMVFPEGTRVTPGEAGRYGIGGAVLAQTTGYPVVPVAHNAGEFWPRKGFVKRPGTITLVIGPAIDARGKSAEQIRDEARAWIEAKSREISTLAKPARTGGRNRRG
jgi:1-acyl-sn-glycerol-3-phosphate acyltransferase